jgi:hypothetical protein
MPGIFLEFRINLQSTSSLVPKQRESLPDVVPNPGEIRTSKRRQCRDMTDEIAVILLACIRKNGIMFYRLKGQAGLWNS